ncbi:hypothetical protein QTP88_026162 [Uroleucon formosanum]
MLVSLDLQKAYDMVWRDKVLSILMKWDINDLMFKFLTNFLMNRSIRVKTHNTLSNLHPIENGLPQGSALSVTLFLVAINDIGKKLPFPVKYKLFADDCIIYCSGSNLTTSTQLIQEALNILSQWSSRIGFTFSPSKTQSIIFNKKNNYPSPQITLDKTPLLFTNNLRILGLIFDHKLSWKAHIRNLKSSCSTRISIIKTLSNLTWGLDQNSLTLIYKSLILSLINYGSVIYGTTKRNLLNTLDPIHNQGIRLATGAFRTSPTDSILCNAGVPPLQFIRDINTTKYMIKTSNLPNHISSSNFHHPFPNFRSKTLNKIFENFNRIKENINLNIVVGTEVIKFRLPSFTSISTAESYAIYKAVQYAASSHINSFLIISDSFSALISLQEQYPQNELIQLTKECIISSKNKINFMWVPSHVGIHGNEKADTMADEAVTSESTSSITKSTTKDLINEAQKRILKSWQNHWDDTPTSNKLRNIKKTVTKWPYPINASRREQITINRARIGHSNITHSYLITKEPKPRRSFASWSLLSLDVKNAFNSLRWPVIDEALRNKNTPDYIVFMIRSWLSGRELLVEEQMASKTVTCGVPQGSVLGPTLWNVAYNYLLDMEVPQGAQLVGFVDDLAVVGVAKTSELLENLLNPVLAKIDDWMTTRGLQLAHHKTEAVMLTKKWAYNPVPALLEGASPIGHMGPILHRAPKTIRPACYNSPQLSIGGTQIQLSKHLRYLEVILDSRLFFVKHAETVAKKTSMSAIALFKANAEHQWTSSVEEVIISIGSGESTALHRPSLVGSCKLSTAKARTILRRPQRVAALRTIRAYRTVSDEAAFVLSGMLPVDLVAEERTRIKARGSEDLLPDYSPPTRTTIKKEERRTTIAEWKGDGKAPQRPHGPVALFRASPDG